MHSSVLEDIMSVRKVLGVTRFATRNKCLTSSNKCLTSSNKVRIASSNKCLTSSNKVRY